MKICPNFRAAWLCGAVACGLGAPGCRSGPAPPEPEDRQFDLTSRAAREAFDQENLAQSAQLYEQAFERACLRDDARGAADASFSLAAVRARLRDYEAALEALRLTDARADDSPVPPDRLLLRGRILVEMGRYADAGRVVDTLAAPPSQVEPTTRVAIEELRGLAAAGRGDAVAARRQLAALDAIPASATSPSRSRLAAAVAGLEQRWGDAAVLSDQEAGQHRGLKNHAAMAEALARAGEAYARHDEPLLAADRFLRAGRSAALQRARLPADEWLRRAGDLGAACGSAAICDEAWRWQNRAGNSETVRQPPQTSVPRDEVGPVRRVGGP